MAPKDLNLEFEDEAEEAERSRLEEEHKRKAALHQTQSADLEFSAQGMDAAPTGEAKDTVAPTKPAPVAKKVQAKAQAQVSTPTQRNIKVVAAEKGPAAPSEKDNIRVVPFENDKREVEQVQATAPVSENISHSHSHSGRVYSEVEVNALIRAAVAEGKLEMIADLTAETKELELKVTRLLMNLVTKAPALKKEFAPIQKMLQEHTRCPLILTQKRDQKKAA